MTAERDPYAVLGVARDANASAIATAYRALARQHHPDVATAQGTEQQMAEINAAWAILRDPRRRWAWDRANGVERPSSTPDTTGTSTAGTPYRRDAPPGGDGRPGRVAWRRGPNGEGAAGPPPGSPRGSVLPFGRHIGWSLGEVARVDPGYLAWLVARDEGAPYREEIDGLLATILPRTPGGSPATGRRRTSFR